MSRLTNTEDRPQSSALTAPNRRCLRSLSCRRGRHHRRHLGPSFLRKQEPSKTFVPRSGTQPPRTAGVQIMSGTIICQPSRCVTPSYMVRLTPHMSYWIPCQARNDEGGGGWRRTTAPTATTVSAPSPSPRQWRSRCLRRFRRRFSGS